MARVRVSAIQSFMVLFSGASILVLLALIRLYSYSLAWLLGGHCRFEPSCSVYASTAIARFGPIRGMALTLGRLLRCHPWSASGEDPVPDPKHPPHV